MMKRIKDWLLIQRFIRHRKEFKYIWLLLFAFVAACLLVSCDVLDWAGASSIIRILLCVISLYFFTLPMNAVYGLMGTSGSIRLYFINFAIIGLIFSSIYYWGFFKDAGISYDVNQPHIDYQIFADGEGRDTVITSEKRDTMFFEHQLDGISYNEAVTQVTTIQYQRITFLQVWRSSILTTLTQEPTDLLSNASIHNSAMSCVNPNLNKQKCDLLEWVLIFHIIISWMFFGVFISLLYNKFRHES